MSKHKGLKDMKCPTGRDIESFLEGEGWEFESQNGSHKKYRYAKNGAEVIVAGHGNQPIPKGTWCTMRRAILAAMTILVLVVFLPLVIL